MSKVKKEFTINVGASPVEVETTPESVESVEAVVTDWKQHVNRYIKPSVLKEVEDSVSLNPSKALRIVAYANQSDEIFLQAKNAKLF